MPQLFPSCDKFTYRDSGRTSEYALALKYYNFCVMKMCLIGSSSNQPIYTAFSESYLGQSPKALHPFQYVSYYIGCSINMHRYFQVNWLKNEGFAGWMVWALDSDDFSGTFCKAGKYPLIKALKNALSGGRCASPPII